MQLRRIEITGFRGIRRLSWCPSPGINVLLGPGDTGKTSILDAVALVLSAQPSQAAAESDYWNLDTSQPFRIAVVLGGLSDEFLALAYPPPLWGWDQSANELHSAPADDESREAAICVQVTGTADLELQHRILQPSADERGFSVSHRSAAGLWNVGTNRAAGAQLRVTSGSLLERAVGRGRLRAPAAAAMQGAQNLLELPADLLSTLARLEDHLRDAGVDIEGLRLGLVPSPGQSPVQLISLVVQRGDGQVPLASFGRGSQQMAMLALAAAEVVGDPIAVVDEIETGLEPYRQRALFERLRDMVSTEGQAFVTTHSPTVLSLVEHAEAWRLRVTEELTEVMQIRGALHDALRRDPEALLCRLPLVCEGETEIGVLRTLCRAAGAKVDALGVRLIDGRGHEPSLELIERLHDLGTSVCGLVDNEDFASGRRSSVSTLKDVHLATSEGGRCLEEAVVNAAPLAALDDFLRVPGKEGPYLDVTARIQQVTTSLGAQSRRQLQELVTEYGEDAIREAVGTTAAKRGWFKGVAGGEDLGRFILEHLPENCRLRLALDHLLDSTLRYLTPAAHAAD